jgi:hypothetical protein
MDSEMDFTFCGFLLCGLAPPNGVEDTEIAMEGRRTATEVGGQITTEETTEEGGQTATAETTLNATEGRGHSPKLPPEVISRIIVESVTETSECALSLLCPEWNLCHRRHAELEQILRCTRVDTFTLPSTPGERGHVSTTFGHGPEDHIWLPRIRDPRQEALTAEGGLPSFYRREVLREGVRNSVIVVDQEITEIDWQDLPPSFAQKGIILREKDKISLLPFVDDVRYLCRKRGVTVEAVYGVDGVEKDRFPRIVTGAGGVGHGNDEEEQPEYLYRRIRHLVLNTIPDFATLSLLEVSTNAPASLGEFVRRNIDSAIPEEFAWEDRVEKRLEFERRANLCLEWSRLTDLESLFVDLRGIAHSEGWRRKPYVLYEHVVDLASSLQGKGLKILVIAGLRSEGRYPGPEPATIIEIDEGEWDPATKLWRVTRGNKINWWRLFRGVVRPGGRLILVDKRQGDGSLT